MATSRIASMQVGGAGVSDKDLSLEGAHDCKYANFWVAYDALDKGNKQLIEKGIEFAKDL